MGIARVTISMTWFGQVCQNVIHLDYGELYDPDEIKGVIETQWIPPLRPMQLSTLKYVLVQVRNMSTIGGLTSDYVLNILGSAGSAVEGWGPLCYLWSLKSDLGGHAGRGRIYLPGCYPGNVVLGRFISASMDQQVAAKDTITGRFIGSGASTGYRLCVTKRENLPATNWVVQIIPRDVPGVQRRRNIGVGI